MDEESSRRRGFGARLRHGFLATLLVAQLLWIFVDQVVHIRYFSWAALQAITLYSLRVRIGNQILSEAESCARYHFDTCGFTPRALFQLKKAVRDFETTYGRSDQAQVHLTYRINEGPAKEWDFPERSQ